MLINNNNNNNTFHTNVLEVNQHVSSGSAVYLSSANGYYKMVIHNHDGQMLVLRSDGTMLWSTGVTSGGQYGPYTLAMQADFNLALYDAYNRLIWSSGTYGKGSGYPKLTLEDNGSLCLRDSNHLTLWSTPTDTNYVKQAYTMYPPTQPGYGQPPVAYPTHPVTYSTPGYQQVTYPSHPQTTTITAQPGYPAYRPATSTVHPVTTTITQTGMTYGTAMGPTTLTPVPTSVHPVVSTVTSVPVVYPRGRKEMRPYRNTSKQCPHRLGTNASLQSQSMNKLTSRNGRYFLVAQADGNLVLYDGPNHVPANCIWDSRTYKKGTGPYTLTMQDDGNLVLYDAYKSALWSSNTYKRGTGPYRLVLRDNGTLAIKDAFRNETWSSRVSRPLFPNVLNSGDSIRSDNGTRLLSPNGRYHLMMQADGNLVLYNGDNHAPQNAIWSSSTWKKGSGPFHLIVQADDNLVLYDSRKTATWASNTCNNSLPNRNCQLRVTDRATIELYTSDNRMIWSSSK